MGDFLVWLVLGAFVVLIFCIYSLSSQLERCVRLAVEIITGNQRRMLEQLEILRRSSSSATASNVVLSERRMGQRRRNQPAAAIADDRRQRGRRREDLAALEDSKSAVLASSEI